MKEFKSLKSINNACSEYTIGEERYTELKNKFEEQIRADEREKFAHELKERFNVEFPSNYPSTKPFFALENARMIVDEVAEEQSFKQ